MKEPTEGPVSYEKADSTRRRFWGLCYTAFIFRFTPRFTGNFQIFQRTKSSSSRLCESSQLSVRYLYTIIYLSYLGWAHYESLFCLHGGLKRVSFVLAREYLAWSTTPACMIRKCRRLLGKPSLRGSHLHTFISPLCLAYSGNSRPLQNCGKCSLNASCTQNFNPLNTLFPHSLSKKAMCLHSLQGAEYGSWNAYQHCKQASEIEDFESKMEESAVITARLNFIG